MASSQPIRILAVNSGSSSLKYAVFDLGRGESRLAGAHVDRSGSAGAQVLVQALSESAGAIDLVGHRIVHGGPRHVAPERVTAALLRDLRQFSALDPEHLPPALDVLGALRRALPRARHYVCFDTAFHRDMPEVAQRYPLAEHYFHEGVRRYGFHGLSYAYLMAELERVAGRRAARGRVLLAHLGSGASLAAVRRGKPVDTTMGYMPSGGLMMATRTGDLDPAVVLRMAQERGGKPLARLSAILNQQSGLLGVSGRSGDLRAVTARAARDRRCALAVDLFVYTAVKFAGALIAAMGGIDTLVFSGGIGEHAPEIRARIADGLAFAGVALDARRNGRGAALLSSRRSRVAVRMIPTDEERMIARAGARLFA
jgi:acetate kinase